MPRFLERDEGERERAVRAVSVGRRAQRAAVLALPEGRRRGSVLTCCICRSCAGACRIAASIQVVTPHFRTREPFVDDEPGERRPDPPRSAATGRDRARTLAEHSGRAIWSRCRARRRAFPERHAAARSGERHDADAAGVRRAGLGDDRHAVQQRAPQHGEGARRAEQGRRGAARADARPRPLGARRGLRRSATARCSASSRAPTRWASCCRATRPACIRSGRRRRC